MFIMPADLAVPPHHAARKLPVVGTQTMPTALFA